MTAGDTYDPTRFFRLDGQVVVLTGASSGLGHRFARMLDALGARLVICARRADQLDALAEQLTGAVAVPGVVCDAAFSAKLIATAYERLGRLDSVGANAGIASVADALVESDDEVRRLSTSTPLARFSLAQAAARAFVEHHVAGSIVFVASIGGIRSSTFLPAPGYSAAKSGLLGYRANSPCSGRPRASG